MLINISGINSRQWDPLQRAAALRDYGMVIDLPFPEVPAAATEEEVAALARDTVDKAMSLASEETSFLVKGEMSLTIAMIDILREAGHTVLIPASERWIDEVRHGKNKQKRTRHKFVRFRKI